MKQLPTPKTIILLLLLLFNNFVFSISDESAPSKWQRIKRSVIGFATAYGTHYTLGLMHIGGHTITANLARKTGYPIKIHERNARKTDIKFGIFIPSATIPKFQNPRINALVNAAGPLSFFLGTYIYLKLINILQEAKKTGCLKTGIKEGLKKNLVNPEQPWAIRSTTLIHIITNLIESIPFKKGILNSDGTKIRANLEALNRELKKNTQHTVRFLDQKEQA